MDYQEVQQAIDAGVVVRRSDTFGYGCVVCKKTMPDIAPHLRGKDHKNNLTREALRQSAPHKFLDFLPPFIRDAKLKNEIELANMASSPYRCIACPKKPVFSGIKNLEDHLKSKDHEEAKKTMLLSPSPSLDFCSHDPQTQVIPSHQNPPANQYIQHPSYPSNSCLQPSLVPAIQKYQLQPQYPSVLSPYPLQVAEAKYLNEFPSQRTAASQLYPPPSQPLYNSTYERLQHDSTLLTQYTASTVPAERFQQTSSLQAAGATGVAHFPTDGMPSSTGLEPEVQRALDKGEVVRDAENSFTCQVCSKTVTGPAPLLEHLKSDRHRKKVPTQLLPNIGRLTAVGATGVTHFPTDGTPSSTGLELEVQRALDKGEVVKDAENSFTCQVCSKTVTGPAPLLEHLKSDRHRKKVPTQLLPNIGRLTLADREYESLPIVTGRADQVDGLPWQVVPSTQPYPPSEDVYRNVSMPRGLVLIFNYYFYGGEKRHGAQRDSSNLKKLFAIMGYQVYLYEDRSKTDTNNILNNIQKSQFLKLYDSFIVFILSHGKEDSTFYAGGISDQDCMSLEEVRNRFTDSACPDLKGKPKLFFVSFCRGDQIEPQIQYDNLSSSQVAPKDMVTVYACINRFAALREPEKGTVFVQVLCEVLAAHSHNTELNDLYRLFCTSMEDRRGTTPEKQDYGFSKKFFFNPIQP